MSYGDIVIQGDVLLPDTCVQPLTRLHTNTRPDTCKHVLNSSHAGNIDQNLRVVFLRD